MKKHIGILELENMVTRIKPSMKRLYNRMLGQKK
jgi:hypothetical protein